MKQILTATILASTIFTASAFAADTAAKTATPAAQPAANVNLSTDEAKLSYVLGLNIGANFRAQHVQINPAVLAKGVSDAITGTQPAMTPGQMQEVIGKFQKEMVEKRTAELKALAEKNAKDGEAFMKENAKKPGVQTLGEEGKEIQYKVIAAGKGALPKETDMATLTYTGKLITGQVFDSTEKNGGKPIDLAISNMIPGMKIALMKMPVGSTWEIVIPANLAYGVMGIPNSPIGPNATLVFDLTLNALKPGIAPAAPKTKTA